MDRSETSARPKALDIAIDYPRRRIPIDRIRDSIAEFNKIPELGRDTDVRVRKEGVILSSANGETLILEEGRVRARFVDVATKAAASLTKEIATSVARICDWKADIEPVRIDIDLVYNLRVDFDPVQYMAGFVRMDELERRGLVANRKVAAAGLELFASPLEDRSNDLRIEIAPQVLEPRGVFYVRVIGLKKETTLPVLEGYVEELTTVANTVLGALASGQA